MKTLDKAADMLGKKFYIQAIQLLLGYLEYHDCHIGHYQLGIAYSARFDYKKSRDSFQKSVELNETPYNHLQLGRTELILGNYASAVKALKRSVELEASAEGLMLLGSALIKIGEPCLAIEALKNSINLNADWSNYKSLGDAYFCLKDFGSAIEAYTRALSYADHAIIKQSLIASLFMGGRVSDGESLLLELADADQGFAHVYATLCTLIPTVSSNRLIELLKKVLVKQPDRPILKNLYASLLGHDPIIQRRAYRLLERDSILFCKQDYNMYWVDDASYQYSKVIGVTAIPFTKRDDLRIHVANLLTNKEGLFLEFGVFNGHSINLFAQRLPGQTLHGFDSFEGLPEDWSTLNKKGDYSSNNNIPVAPSNVAFHKGWFEDTLPIFLSSTSEKVAFVHIDSDLYSSAKTVLDCLASRIKRGTIVLFDEYINYDGWNEHEFKAFKEFCKDNKVTYKYLAYLKGQRCSNVAVEILGIGVEG